MALKETEIFVRDCLISFLGGPKKVRAWEGDNPPDIYLQYNNQECAVEITELAPSRLTQDAWGAKLINEINLLIKDELSLGLDLNLILYLPVRNPKLYKKSLKNWIKSFIKKDLSVGDEAKLNIDGKDVNIRVTKGDNNIDERVSGWIIDEKFDGNITVYAEETLRERILTKNDICKNIGYKGPFWLALYYDTFWIADHDSFFYAMKKIDVEHIFEEIFVISSHKEVRQIYKKGIFLNKEEIWRSVRDRISD